MTDIADRPRTFVVRIGYPFAGCPDEEETVVVAAGDDADKVCSDVLDTMIGNHLETGWTEVE